MQRWFDTKKTKTKTKVAKDKEKSKDQREMYMSTDVPGHAADSKKAAKSGYPRIWVLKSSWEKDKSLGLQKAEIWS